MITSVKLFTLAHPITISFHAQKKIASKVRKGLLPQSNFTGIHTQKVHKFKRLFAKWIWWVLWEKRPVQGLKQGCTYHTMVEMLSGISKICQFFNPEQVNFRVILVISMSRFFVHTGWRKYLNEGPTFGYVSLCFILQILSPNISHIEKPLPSFVKEFTSIMSPYFHVICHKMTKITSITWNLREQIRSNFRLKLAA